MRLQAKTVDDRRHDIDLTSLQGPVIVTKKKRSADIRICRYNDEARFPVFFRHLARQSRISLDGEARDVGKARIATVLGFGGC